jgi:hypothetical protein
MDTVYGRSHISLVDRQPNANTRLAAPGPHIDPEDLDVAYARARGLDAPRLPDAVRLVWMKGEELGFLDLRAKRDTFAVVGRHLACDVVLAGDGALALRHLLVRAVTLEDGTIATRILDLKTGQGFHLDDDAQRRALVASGPVALRLGRYALVALPPGELPAVRPAPSILDAPCMPVTGAPGLTTRVTTLPPAPLLEDIARDIASAGFARITLRHGSAWASVDVSEAALDAGVLVGRADRCETRLRPALTDGISRTHLLLLREHGTVHAFDVASTQGVYAADRPVRRVRMPDAGGTLRLGTSAPVMLEWHPRASG